MNFSVFYLSGVNYQPYYQEGHPQQGSHWKGPTVKGAILLFSDTFFDVEGAEKRELLEKFWEKLG